MYIYHYCSNSTFYKIVHNQELWMTDISRSNDYDEMKLFVPGIFIELEKIYGEASFAFRYENEEGLQAFQKLLHRTNDHIKREIDKGFLTSYVACFSKEMDLLSQWRGYADNAKGCSIGFSLEELEEYCARSNGVITINRVEYIKKTDLESLLRDKAKELLPRFRSLRDDANSLFTCQNMKEEETDIMMFFLSLEIIEELLFDSLRYKWSDFKEEKEWRIFFKSITKNADILYMDKENLPSWRIKFDKDYLSQHNKIEFYTKEDCIIPFFPLKLKDISSMPIKRVLLGPNNKSYIQDIKLLFEKEKLGKPGIHYSKISYR